MSSRSVEWHIDAASSRLLRAVVYVVVGLFGGSALLLCCGMAFLGISLAVGGEYAYLAWIALLALVGGPLSLLYLWPMLVEREQRPPLVALTGDREIAERYAAIFTRDRLLAAVLGGAVGLLALAVVDPRLAFGAVVGSILLVPVASGRIARGRIDPEAGSLTYMDRPVDLARIERVRRIDIGGAAVCWLSYYPGHSDLSTPRLISATPEAADAIERAVAEIDPEIDEEYAPTHALQVAFAALSLCFLGLAALMFVVEPGSAGDPVLQWYIAASFGILGFFLAFAAVLSG